MADLTAFIQERLRAEYAADPSFYEPSPGQLPDHVHNRVARVVADEAQRWCEEQGDPFDPPDRDATHADMMDTMQSLLTAGVLSQAKYVPGDSHPWWIRYQNAGAGYEVHLSDTRALGFCIAAKLVLATGIEDKS